MDKKAKKSKKKSSKKKFLKEHQELSEQLSEEGEQLKSEEQITQDDTVLVKKEEDKAKEENLKEITILLKNHNDILKEEAKNEWEKEQWNDYLQRCGKPNPLVTCEVNNYISTWRDLTENEDAISIMKESHQCIELIRDLERALEDVPDTTPEEKTSWKISYKNLQDLLQEKINNACYNFLLHSEEYMRLDTFNMQHVESDVGAIPELSTEERRPSIQLYLWANLSQIPRHKGPKFVEIGHIIEPPYCLMIKRCAICLIHTSFDPYSNLSMGGLDLELLHEEENAGEEITPAVFVHSPQLSIDPLEKQSLPSSAKSSKVESVGSRCSTPSKSGQNVSGSRATSSPSTEKALKIETEGNNKQELLQTDYLKDFKPLQIVDMVGNHIVGGVFHIYLTEIPPQPVEAECWILQQVERKRQLKHIPFEVHVLLPRSPKSDMKPTQAANFIESENKRYEKELQETISVCLKLPEHVLYLDQPQLAFWNKEKRVWVNNGFYEVKYNEDSKLLTFKMVHFGIIGIVQNKYINFPYQSWELRPQANYNNSCLTLTGTFVSLTIEISGGLCCVLKLQTLEDSMSHPELYNKWMKAHHLLKNLKDIGVFLVPDDAAVLYLGNTPKNGELEDNVYKCMAVLSNVYMFGSSHWNTTVGPQKIVMKYAETCGKECEGINTLLRVDSEQAVFLQCAELSSSYKDDPIEDKESYSTLHCLMLSVISEEGCGRLKVCKTAYYNCVYTILSSMKLLSY